jgi:hypothetical protein
VGESLQLLRQQLARRNITTLRHELGRPTGEARTGKPAR